jgi:hypothetical protein
MVRELYENAVRGIDTRQNLSALRSAVKDDAGMNDLFELVEDDLGTMTGFLDSDDPKVRKNAALLMGELDMFDFIQPLVNGYRKESQLFVRSAYLEALKGYDIEEYLPFFKGRVKELSYTEITPENRKHVDEELKALMEKIRAKIPDIVLRTTLITGFPGETTEQFNELAEFVKEMRFDRLGCSAEEGTAAAKFDDQIDDEVKEHRAEIIMEQQQLISEEKNAEKLGSVMETVVEGFDKWAECYFGRTKGDAPDVDGYVFINTDEELMSGDFVKVKITGALEYDLIGEIYDEFTK